MRRHHYIPQFYLSSFTLSGDTDGALWVTDRVMQKHWQATPASAAFIRGFYAPAHSQADPEAVEKGLAGVESKLAPAYRAVVATGRMPEAGSQEYGLIMNLVALMFVRVPAVRQAHDKHWEQVFKMLLSIITEKRERFEVVRRRIQSTGVELPDVSFERFQDTVRSEKCCVKLGPNAGISHMFRLLDVILPLLSRRNWCLGLCEDNSPDLICSDVPVSLTWVRPIVGLPPGFGHRETVLTMPLNKRMALVGCFEPLPPTTILRSAHIGDINGCTLRAAQFAFAPTEHIFCRAS